MILQLLVVLAYWLAAGAVEGWKWRHADGKVDDHPLISWNSYHIWQAASALLVIVMPMALSSLPTFIFAHAIGWLCYARMISWIRYEDILADNGLFHVINNIWIPRTNPAIEIALALVGLALYVLLSASL